MRVTSDEGENNETRPASPGLARNSCGHLVKAWDLNFRAPGVTARRLAQAARDFGCH